MYLQVLADGTITTCTRDENSDLFYAIPWSYGTLGFLTAVDIMIIPFKPYIKMVYEPTYSLEETTKVFERETNENDADSGKKNFPFSKYYFFDHLIRFTNHSNVI